MRTHIVFTTPADVLIIYKFKIKNHTFNMMKIVESHLTFSIVSAKALRIEPRKLLPRQIF